MTLPQPFKGILLAILLLASSKSLLATTNYLTNKEGDIYCDYQAYTNNISDVYYINTGTYQPIIFDYYYCLDWYSDYFQIFSIDNSGIESLRFDSRDQEGDVSGTISTNIPSGRAKIVFITNDVVCYNDDYWDLWGMNIYYHTESYAFGTSTLTNSNATIAGNLGIGISNPATRLHIDGAIRGNETGGALKVSTTFGSLVMGPQNSSYTDIITDRSYFKFNKPIYLTAGKLSTSYTSTNLDFQIVGSTKMSLLSNGNLGVGITNPKGRLNTKALANAASMTLGSSTQPGLSVTSSDDGAFGMYFGVSNTGQSWIQGGRTDSPTAYDILLQSAGGKVGIGATGTLTQALTLKGGMSISSSDVTPVETYLGSLMITKPATSAQYINLARTGGSTWSIGTVYNSNDFAIGLAKASDSDFSTPSLTIKSNGTIVIGTPAQITAYALDVNGIICANEVKVTMNHFPDFVFESDYKLPKLQDVHSYIKANGHLPNIPSAAEVKESGIGLADMQVKLLQKVEELTLYVIEQQKEIESLKKSLNEVKK